MPSASAGSMSFSSLLPMTTHRSAGDAARPHRQLEHGRVRLEVAGVDRGDDRVDVVRHAEQAEVVPVAVGVAPVGVAGDHACAGRGRGSSASSSTAPGSGFRRSATGSAIARRTRATDVGVGGQVLTRRATAAISSRRRRSGPCARSMMLRASSPIAAALDQVGDQRVDGLRRQVGHRCAQPGDDGRRRRSRATATSSATACRRRRSGADVPRGAVAPAALSSPQCCDS